MINHGALFAGIGGFVAAAKRLGWNTTMMNELNEGCSETLKHNFGASKVLEDDITNLPAYLDSVKNLDIDVLSAGFPCQSFSQAGSNLGFKDPRGALFFEIPKVVQSLPAPPKVIVLENVAYLWYFDKGSRLKVVLNTLRRLGYWVSQKSCVVLDTATHTGIPQRRERLFIVATHSDTFRKNSFESDATLQRPAQPLSEYIDKREEKDPKYYVPVTNKYGRMLYEAVQKYGGDRLYQVRRSDVRPCGVGICPTLTANMGRGGHNVPFVSDAWGVRRLTVQECLRLQGFRLGEFYFPNDIIDSEQYEMIGNAVTVDAAQIVFQAVTDSVLQ